MSNPTFSRVKGNFKNPLVFLPIIDEKGKPLNFVKTSIFKKDDVTYFCILREYSLASTFSKNPIKCEIAFDKKGYVYDILEDKEYGYTDKVDLILLPDSVKILSVIPYEVKEIKLNTDKKNYEKGDIVKCQIELDTKDKYKGAHVVKVEVFKPDGKKEEIYSKNIVLKENKGELIIPLSLNEINGKWKIIAKDLTSGKKGMAEFSISQ